jgi:hypothetical protein
MRQCVEETAAYDYSTVLIVRTVRTLYDDPLILFEVRQCFDSRFEKYFGVPFFP